MVNNVIYIILSPLRLTQNTWMFVELTNHCRHLLHLTVGPPLIA